MKYYQIKETLTECGPGEAADFGQFVAVLSPDEWLSSMEAFDMGIELDLSLGNIITTKAEVNYDSLTGSFCIPDREDLSAPGTGFAFALDEKGIVFIDDGNTADNIISRIRKTKKWNLPSLERFIYDFLEQIIKDDAEVLSRYELELSGIEDGLSDSDSDKVLLRLNEIRGRVRNLRMHYEQLMDFSQELEENENSFFQPENLRYFRLFTSRIANLRDTASFVRDYTVQLREYYESQMDLRQNHIMTVLTVITSIFMPLTLITGWYGMNFRYMPELNMPWAYPTVFGLCAVIAVVCLVCFKKKKWL